MFLICSSGTDVNTKELLPMFSVPQMRNKQPIICPIISSVENNHSLCFLCIRDG